MHDLALIIAPQQIDAIPVWIAAVPVFVHLLTHAKGGDRQVVGEAKEPGLVVHINSLTAHIALEVGTEFGLELPVEGYTVMSRARVANIRTAPRERQGPSSGMGVCLLGLSEEDASCICDLTRRYVQRFTL